MKEIVPRHHAPHPVELLLLVSPFPRQRAPAAPALRGHREVRIGRAVKCSQPALSGQILMGCIVQAERGVLIGVESPKGRTLRRLPCVISPSPTPIVRLQLKVFAGITKTKKSA